MDNNKDTAEIQREHFNNIANNYDKTVNDEKAVYYRNLVYKMFFRNTSIQRMITSGKKLDVLDAMCGLGNGRIIMGNVFSRMNIYYEGFDYSDEMVKLARIKNPGYTFFRYDVNVFTSEKKYDIVLLLSGLHHIPNNTGRVIKNMAACIKNRGAFISVEPTYNNIISKFLSDRIYKRSKFYNYDTERRFSLDELNSYYKEAGLVIERQIYPGLLAYLLWFFNPYPIMLKIGSKKTVKKLFKFERKLYSSNFGKRFSVATFTILRKYD